MAQATIFSGDKTYLERVMRRLIPVMSVALVIFTLYTLQSVFSSASTTLRTVCWIALTATHH